MGGSIPSPTPAPRRRRASRTVLGVVLGLVLLGAPLLYLAVDGDSSSSEQSRRRVETPEALDQVRAAVGRTAAAGSYAMDTTTTTSSPGGNQCVDLPDGPGPQASTSRQCFTTSGRSYTFESHSVVNFEPYAMVSESDTPFGFITLHVNSERAWQKNGLNVGYVGDTAPGVPLPEYSSAVLGTLGPGPGSLAMISIGSRGGHLNLEEEAIATAEPAGTGTVGDVAVTYYDVTIDMTRLADAPGLSAAQRATIADALPILERSGYVGTQERLGVDDAGYVREVSATTTMGDGSTTTRHSVLYDFGCAPRVTMPDEPPGDGAPLGPCVDDPTTTSTVPSTSTTVAPPSTTAATTVPTSAPPPTTSTPGPDPTTPPTTDAG